MLKRFRCRIMIIRQSRFTAFLLSCVCRILWVCSNYIFYCNDVIQCIIQDIVDMLAHQKSQRCGTLITGNRVFKKTQKSQVWHGSQLTSNRVSPKWPMTPHHSPNTLCQHTNARISHILPIHTRRSSAIRRNLRRDHRRKSWLHSNWPRHRRSPLHILQSLSSTDPFRNRHQLFRCISRINWWPQNSTESDCQNITILFMDLSEPTARANLIKEDQATYSPFRT